ncbi:MAG: DinB family protein [Anaerolineaceae bacterium]|nr:DinB family protein [Anaerolineaceae bacterium]
MESDAILRQELLALLRGGNAHMPLEEAAAGFPEAAMNSQPPNVPYTPWHLLEHLRRTQLDILEFIRDPKYVSPEWPVGYWPAPDEQTEWDGWEETLRRFETDLADLKAIVNDTVPAVCAGVPACH